MAYSKRDEDPLSEEQGSVLSYDYVHAVMWSWIRIQMSANFFIVHVLICIVGCCWTNHLVPVWETQIWGKGKSWVLFGFHPSKQNGYDSRSYFQILRLVFQTHRFIEFNKLEIRSWIQSSSSFHVIHDTVTLPLLSYCCLYICPVIFLGTKIRLIDLRLPGSSSLLFVWFGFFFKMCVGFAFLQSSGIFLNSYGLLNIENSLVMILPSSLSTLRCSSCHHIDLCMFNLFQFSNSVSCYCG